MKYIIDEFGDLGYMLNGEVHYCLCHKMTRGPRKAMFCGLDCPFFKLTKGHPYGPLEIVAVLSCSSNKIAISIDSVAGNIDNELTNKDAS